MERPVDAHDPGLIIDWARWAEPDARKEESANDAISGALDDWYAGAEAELLAQYGLIGSDAEPHYMGIGKPPEVVVEPTTKRFRDVPDELGIIGHRLEWACRACNLIQSLGPMIIEAAGSSEVKVRDRAAAHIETLSRFGHRACSFAREEHVCPNDADGDALWPLIRRGMKMIGELVRSRHGRRPRLMRWRWGFDGEDFNGFDKMAMHLEDAMRRFAAHRTRRARARLRKWAEELPEHAGHKVTKAPDSTFALSASADKSHAGEQTPQRAADMGAQEWGRIWRSSVDDQADEIMNALDALQIEEGDMSHPAIALPPIDPAELGHTARQVRATTGIGGDWIRLFHIGRLLTRGALAALAKWYMAVERAGRWPAVIRSIIEVALSKKAGGARLIGLAASLYRLWARHRYKDIKAVLEGRLVRPELAAAPGRGAQGAVFEVALANEVAVARDGVAATSIVDISKFYEYIDIAEFAGPAIRLGMPRCIIALAAHFYLGPRRIRVRGAYSEAMHPRRSIVAGCTWCTVLIRVAVAAPLDGLTNQLKKWMKEWNVNVLTRMYIDDCAVSTMGSVANVTLVHTWISEYIMSWVRVALRKRVAMDKLQCIAAHDGLRQALRRRLRPIGYNVVKVGELLGTDFAGGGRLARRRLQEQRRRKAAARRRRLRWWSKLGRNAAKVIDTGLFPSVSYGMHCNGLPPAVLRDARRTRGAFAMVKCHGSSLTAKLATGGKNFSDVDPASVHPAPPLLYLLNLLFDFPRYRFNFVFAWRMATRDFVEVEGQWKAIRGPVGAAMCHLRRLGASWPAPFRIVIGSVSIDICTTPPKQVYAYLRDSARVALDLQMLGNMITARAWDRSAVLERYKHGVDWDMMRRILASKSVSPVGRRALQIFMAGGFWSDERRWLSGLKEDPSCALCQEAVGDDEHFIAAQCPAVQIALMWRRLAGEDCSDPQCLGDPSLSPLIYLGLPPRAARWLPTPEMQSEGWLTMGGVGMSYGDGSGYRQQLRCGRIATWSVVRLRVDQSGKLECAEALRGVVPGLFPTVPRAEIYALFQHLRHAGQGACYGGDCKHVIDTFQKGIEPYFTSSRCVNADLWRKVKWAQDDHGIPMGARKIKAHASREAAVEQGSTVEDWEGNRTADAHCKQLARAMAEDGAADGIGVRTKVDYRRMVDRIVAVATWALRYRQQFAKGNKSHRGPKANGGQDGSAHHIVTIAPGRWRCSVCRREAWAPRVLQRLRKSACQGHIANSCHGSHQLDVVKGILWCRRCGAYTTRQPRALRRQCPGCPMSEAARNVRARLARGMAPTTAHYLKAASIADWTPYAAPAKDDIVEGRGQPGDGGKALEGDQKRDGPASASAHRTDGDHCQGNRGEDSTFTRKRP